MIQSKKSRKCLFTALLGSRAKALRLNKSTMTKRKQQKEQ